ncbi:UDP-N-acetylmuramoyl-L-alanyl-D-glutamate--2,6-diaminopimelate ligase [Kocuria rhizophila]|uniref:Mur ligase family protein n=1 Tax=Kocuria rhizophila TaxID=72000 RepID=UPI0038674BD2|nr:UDP-N-acetylmuramoyl-L-alanyl-D-glutamate--2,6-diaminopimelate ligase [Kocuria rhizophila]WSZ52688.1 UDP-N-acetylmuramoyl-L-alanyl-D-glutamate--2,6-diaminopimelate ligase [Kocuria rhizophila]
MSASGSRERSVAELAHHVGAVPGAGRQGIQALTELIVCRVTEEHGEIHPGDLFVARQGRRRHGAEHAVEAVALGAVAVLTDARGLGLIGQDLPVPVLVHEDPSSALGPMAALLHGEPSREMPVFGITGTNGKTTTAYILEAALRRLGACPGLLSTPETVIGSDRRPSAMTTPTAPHVQELLARMRETGNDTAVMEVSSHALDQGRVNGVRFASVGFTNLSHEHQDYHGDMESYFRAKARLFTPQLASRAVIVVDDAAGRQLDQLARRRGLPTTTLSTRAETAAAWQITGEQGTDEFELLGSRGRLRLRAPLPGEHNRVNTALAALMLIGAGHSMDEVARALHGPVSVPGRMERVDLGPRWPTVLVDFAHTPDATAKSVSALRARTRGLLVVTASSGGDRDKAKRELTGRAVVEAGADVVLVTDDNPRSEDPAAIRAAVMRGVRAAVEDLRASGRPEPEILEAPTRRDAIRGALELAGPQDTIALYGKGHERWMEIGPTGTRIPFVDSDEVRAAAARMTAPGLGAAGTGCAAAQGHEGWSVRRGAP